MSQRILLLLVKFPNLRLDGIGRSFVLASGHEAKEWSGLLPCEGGELTITNCNGITLVYGANGRDWA